MRLLIMMLCCLLICAPAQAAPKEFGHLQPEDFSYKAVSLGATVEDMHRALGEELFDTDKDVFNIHVKFYTYKKYVIGVEADTGLVADIVIKDEDFRLRDDVCRGSTAYKVFMTYGKTERRTVEGKTYYVYENPQRPQERLLLELDAGGTNAVERARLTSLPLTEEEAARRQASEPWQGNGLDDLLLQRKEIDMSALGENAPQPPDKKRGHGRAKINYHYEINKRA